MKKLKNVISLLLEQQLAAVEEEITEREKQKEAMEAIQREMKNYSNFSIENLTDIANQLKNRKKLKQTRVIIFIGAMIAELMETGTFIFGVIQGIWWPFGIGLLCCLLVVMLTIVFYYNRIAYICPECHEVFRPGKEEFFFAPHTPTTRKLKCIRCGHKGYCVETYLPNKKVIAN